MRQKLELNNSVQEVVRIMSEGNPGALRLCMQLLQSEDGLGLILDLDDMNIRASAIWIAYKDHCREDMDLFKKLIRARDADMVATVNKESYGEEPLAVTHGGSNR